MICPKMVPLFSPYFPKRTPTDLFTPTPPHSSLPFTFLSQFAQLFNIMGTYLILCSPSYHVLSKGIYYIFSSSEMTEVLVYTPLDLYVIRNSVPYIYELYSLIMPELIYFLLSSGNLKPNQIYIYCSDQLKVIGKHYSV